ncbi:MAG: disulfide bond formation protein DsbA [Chitinophagaceae bacterium BSSC1]|nr:MAG: disulfide bond formation protein DsbA [Chitinophagaceae bacterium BSSC1]
MKIEIWSDVVCPFCYIGKRKFEKALEGFDQKEQVEIEWKSFQLDSEMAPAKGISVHQYLADRKGVSLEKGKEMNDYMTNMAKEVGLEYDFEKAVISNTLNAHRLLHFAKTKGLQQEAKERLFASYYTMGRDLGDLDTLVMIAQEIGLDPAAVRTMLESDEFINDVKMDQYHASQIGVQGVPFFVFNNKYAVSGAQPSSVFSEVLEKVWQEEQPLVNLGSAEGTCSIDGVCN